MQEQKYLTITEFTSRLKGFFDASTAFQNMYLKGEISNFKKHSTGHLYFSIKDEGSVITAMMWARDAAKLSFEPTEGTKVLVHGRVTVYEARGTYQIYVDEMQEDGIGNLYAMYEKLKKELEKEGLFNEEHKKEIPKFPKRVGVITAPTGAAIRDIISTIKRRYPVCEVILFPSLVQGEGAAPNIVENIKKAEDYNLDVLIVGRGGGSIEDLWAFNEEIVARAIYNSTIPIISAVGHEVDFTIADFVADKRAATPTGAAELAVPNLIDVQNNLLQLSIRSKEAITKKIKLEHVRLDKLKNSYLIKNPLLLYENKKLLLDQDKEKINALIKYRLESTNALLRHQYEKLSLVNPKVLCINKEKDLYNLYINLNNNMKHKLEIIKTNYLSLIDKLDLLNPLNILKRGYSVTYLNEKTITSVKSVLVNDNIRIKLTDGVLEASISSIREDI